MFHNVFGPNVHSTSIDPFSNCDYYSEYNNEHERKFETYKIDTEQFYIDSMTDTCIHSSINYFATHKTGFCWGDGNVPTNSPTRLKSTGQIQITAGRAGM